MMTLSRTADTPNGSAFAYRPEVADYVGVSVDTLARWACRGIGPRYAVIGGRCRYRWSDVDAWLDAQFSANGGQL